VSKPKPIKERIREAYEPDSPQGMRYYTLAEKVFPVDQFPRAWRGATGGGPPGCAMALSRAIREMGGDKTWTGRGWEVWIPRKVKP